MIYFYSGTPGSGKSLNVARYIAIKLKYAKQNVILCNMQVNEDYMVKSNLRSWAAPLFKKLGKEISTRTKGAGQVITVAYHEMTPQVFYDYARENHVVGQEGQTTIIMDEAQLVFGPTVMKNKKQVNPNYREEWIEFFTLHRHFGFNIIIISQFDRLIDPQIRCLFEYNHIHRKVNNFGIGAILSLFRIICFAEVQYWYGVRTKIGCSFFFLTPWNKGRYKKMYNSHKRFSDFAKEKDNGTLI